MTSSPPPFIQHCLRCGDEVPRGTAIATSSGVDSHLCRKCWTPEWSGADVERVMRGIDRLEGQAVSNPSGAQVRRFLSAERLRTAKPLKHAYDPKMKVGADVAIWHADKRMEALIVDIFEKVKPAQFVETGTHMGWTSHWVASRYPEVTVHTVEILEDYYRLSGENLSDLPNVRRTRADSGAFLKVLTPLPGTTFFWLDAHFHVPNPLLEECRVVSRLKNYVCIIDDFHCGPEFPGDPSTPEAVKVTLGVDYWRPSYSYKTGYSGYAMFLNGVDYTPPKTMRREGER